VSGATIAGSNYELVQVQAGDIELAQAGQYVIFLQATSNGGASWRAADSSNPLSHAGGTFVYQDNSGDTSKWDTEAWNDIASLDAIFEFLFTLGLIPVIPTGPTAQDELAELVAAAGGAGRHIVLDAAGVARNLGQQSLATRDAAFGFELDVDGNVRTSSKSEMPGLVDGLYTWIEFTGFRSDESDNGPANINGGGFQFGADIEVAADMVAGVSLGYSAIDAADTDFSQEGSMIFLQPYLAYRSGDWHGAASLMYGRGEYDQTSLGGDGTGETELMALSFDAGYDIAMDGGYTVTPTFGLIHGRERVKGTGGTLAGVASETYEFTQASLGARVNYDWAGGNVFAGLHADYLDQDAGSVLTDDFLSEDGWTGRVELGTSLNLDNGIGLTTAIDVSGLGGVAQTLSGSLQVNFTY
jgi:uncharacterized protein with beta-barrel porin domain